jgi:precorrin-2 dehydrogenase/sirohydrochlorin ferrochelatase
VAAGRILNLLNADALVTVVCPREGLNAEVAHRVASGQVDHKDSKFEPSDLDGVDLVLTAIDDSEASSRIWNLCRERRLPANIADVPSECDFYFGSVHRDGPLQIMVSTNGKGPRLSNFVRRSIAANLPHNCGRAIESVGRLRQMLRRAAPSLAEGPKRMAWMIKVSDAYSLDELAEMSPDDMELLLQFYAPDKVPRLGCLRAMRQKFVGFDGSFGFCVGC